MNLLIWGIVALASFVAELLTRMRVSLCVFLAALLCVPFSVFVENIALDPAFPCNPRGRLGFPGPTQGEG